MVHITPQQVTNWVINHLDYKSRKNGKELVVNNPMDGDSGWHMCINTEKAVVHDWRPGHQQFDGSFINFVQKYKRISFYEALKDICGQDVNIRSILHPREAKEDGQNVDQAEIQFKLPLGAKPFREINESIAYKIGLRYLESRGITLDIAKKFDIHYGGDRIYFPYYEYGMQVYWQARTIIGKIFEFPSTDNGIGKSKFLFGFDNAEPDQPLFVTESIFNAITLGDCAVATGGADMSIKQCEKVRAIKPSVVVFAPDRDEVGIMSAQKNTETLKSIVDYDIICHFVVPPAPYKDWNDMWRDGPRQYADTKSMPVSADHIKHALQIL